MSDKTIEIIEAIAFLTMLFASLYVSLVIVCPCQ